MPITILHTNDFHGKLTEEMAFQIRKLGEESHALYFDSGDCIKAGNLGVPVRREPCWRWLEMAGCSASVPGNRESHVLRSAFEAKIAGRQHPILCANLRDRTGNLVLQESIAIEHSGTKVGVFGVMVPMVTSKMKTQAASAFLWDPPLEAAARVVQELRKDCDLLIALTHIGISQDRELAEKCPEIDLILGGHTHTVLDPPERLGGTWICQGGSHARYIGKYLFEVGKGIVESELIPL